MSEVPLYTLNPKPKTLKQVGDDPEAKKGKGYTHKP